MSILDENTVDFIVIDHKNVDIILSISDHLPWDGMESDHFAQLLKKLELYIAFVGSGDLNQKYPGYEDRNVTIDLVHKYNVPADIVAKLNQIKKLIKESNIYFRWRGIE